MARRESCTGSPTPWVPPFASRRGDSAPCDPNGSTSVSHAGRGAAGSWAATRPAIASPRASVRQLLEHEVMGLPLGAAGAISAGEEVQVEGRVGDLFQPHPSELHDGDGALDLRIPD